MTSISKRFDIGAYFYIEFLTSIWKQSYFEDYFDIEAANHIRISKFCTWISNTIIEVSSISKIFDIEFSIDSFGPCSWRRVADSEFRLQLGTGVTEHRLQCRQFIATQFLAQDLKQYPVRSSLLRRRRSGGECEVADGASAAWRKQN